MLYKLTSWAAVHLIFVLFIRSSSTDESNSVREETDTTSVGSELTIGGISATERTASRLDKSTVSSVNESDAFENVLEGELDKHNGDRGSFEQIDDSTLTNQDSDKKPLNDNIPSENITLTPEKQQTSSRYDIETIDAEIDKDTALTVGAFVGASTTQDTIVQTQKSDEKPYKKIVKIPYQIHSDISKVQTLSLNNGQTRIALQHHLQLGK